MAVLIVPPSQTVPFNAEKLVEHRSVMAEFRADAVTLWNGVLKDEVKFGVFRGTKTFDWSQSYDGLLQTFFIYPKPAAKSGQELARVAALFKLDNCQLLGSVVIWGTDYLRQIPKSVNKDVISQLKDAAQRSSSSQKSPIRLSFEGRSHWGTSIAWLSEAVLANQLAAQNLTVHSDLSGLACLRTRQALRPEGNVQKPANVSAEKPVAASKKLHRGHRQIRVVLEGAVSSPDESWPQVQGQFTYIPLPLNVRLNESRGGPLAKAAYSPHSIAQSVTNGLNSLLHDLAETSFKVVKRDGRFVTIERGIAFGLRIGQHLSGPSGEKLHVIRFETSGQAADEALLLIRSESSSAPLKVGDNLRIDQTVYPAP